MEEEERKIKTTTAFFKKGPLKLKKPPHSGSSSSDTSHITSKPPTKTAAQLAFEQAQRERLQKQPQKTHKDRVADFNEKLSKLSEHHDIPKVGPG